MKRSRPLSEPYGLDSVDTFDRTDGGEDVSPSSWTEEPLDRSFLDDDDVLVRNIASFLTLSDAASLASVTDPIRSSCRWGDVTPADSWAVGRGIDGTETPWSLETPPTPALVAVSPGATPAHPRYSAEYPIEDYGIQDYEEDYEYFLRERRRKWAQEKLATAVFAHPHSLRSYCIDAYLAAQEIREQNATKTYNPETMIEPVHIQKANKNNHVKVIHDVVDFFIFHNVPLSVMLDAVDVVGGVTREATIASFQLSITSAQGIAGALGCAAHVVWDTTASAVSNPFRLLEMIISLQFNAMGKTSEVLVSGIQSVATGVESASSIAFHRLSAANLAANRTGSSASLGPGSATRRSRTIQKPNKKLIKKMSSLNEAALVVSYTESGDDTGGLTRHAISRTRRMMHYSVSLRPFVVTVAVKSDEVMHRPTTSALTGNEQSIAPYGSPGASSATVISYTSSSEATNATSVDSHGSSPVICSPQSFPPTPHSRRMVLARGSQFADDVVFLARDRLRIHDGLESHDERTREMALALREGKRLAVFDANGANGIELTCGQHIATKVGPFNYASTRSMVPVLRNCCVYFEATVMPRPPLDLSVQASPVTLAVGLSTVEMPPNSLVGAWQGSVGLCTTGQIFVAGQWCSPQDPTVGAYSYSSTVGCLVFLDDSSAFETWDGVMVNAYVTFNVDGNLVPPPVTNIPLPGASPFNQPQGSQSFLFSTSPTSESEGLLHPPPGNKQGSASPYATQTLLVPASEELYPTVTLQTPATAVMCRFSSEDVIALSRESIGAPPKVSVYAIDGSILFHEDD